MKINFKKVVSIFLVLLLFISNVPINVLANSSNLEVDSSGTKTRYNVLVLDTSGSMGGVKIAALKEAAQKFCETVLTAEGDNYVGIVEYSSSANVVTDFTNNKDELSNTINNLSTGGGTNINDGLIKGDELLSKAPEESIKNLVVFSDGYPENGDSTSKGPFDNGYMNAAYDTAQKLQSKYNVYSLGFFQGFTGTKLEKVIAFMESLQNSGYWNVENPEDLNFAFDDIAHIITNSEIMELYVKQHREYINNPRYPVEITSDFGTNLSYVEEDIENDWGMVGGYNLLDDVNRNVAHFGDNDGTIETLNLKDTYLLLLAQLMANEQGYTGIQNLAVTNLDQEFVGIYGNILQELSRDTTIDKAIIEQLEQKYNVFIDTPFSDEIRYQMMREMNTTLDSVKGISKVLTMVISTKCPNASGLLNTAINYGLDTSEDLIKFASYAEAYAKTSNHFSKVLKRISEKLDSAPLQDSFSSEKEKKDALRSAVDDYLNNIQIDKENNLQYIQDFAKEDLTINGMDQGVKKLTTKLYKANPVTAKVSVVGQYTDYIKTGLDWFTEVDDRAYSANMIPELKFLSSVLYSITQDLAKNVQDTSLSLEDSFDYTGQFDEAINMYKSTNFLACDYGLKYEEIVQRQTMPSLELVDGWGAAAEQVPMWELSASSLASSLLDLQKKLINNITCHSINLQYSKLINTYEYEENDLNIFLMACPVTIEVYDTNQVKVATLSDKEQWIKEGYESYFYRVPLEDQNGVYAKILVVPKDYRVNLIGYGEGKMNASVARYNRETNEIHSLNLFNQIPISSGKTGTYEFNGSTGSYSINMEDASYPGVLIDEYPSEEPSNPDQPVNPDQPDNPSVNPDTPSSDVHVNYSTHIQDIGDTAEVSDGATSGTTGQAKRIEGVKISLSGNTNDLGVEYRTHVQNIDWQNYVRNGQLSGTTGQALRAEALQVRLTGDDAANYDVYYRTHVEDHGWTSWAKNGSPSGSEGYSRRMEAVEIKVLPKNSTEAPDTSGVQFLTNYGDGQIRYHGHVQNIGWQNYVADGATAGTTGQNLRLEALGFTSSPNLPGGDIYTSVYVDGKGWTDYNKNTKSSGTVGSARALKAVKIRLEGDLANQYNVQYRVHLSNEGWKDWVSNNEAAGNPNGNNIEAIQVRLVQK